MKKIAILILVVLVGIGLLFSNAKASPSRTIPMKTGLVYHTNTLIVGHGGSLHKIMGRANSAQASYVVYDEDAVADCIGGTVESQNDILTEGGEATQYDPIEMLDFGEEGIPFNTGLVVITSTADLVLHYK